jgi:peptide/nickel transport system permease protein
MMQTGSLNGRGSSVGQIVWPLLRAARRAIKGGMSDGERAVSFTIIGLWALMMILVPILGFTNPLHQDLTSRLQGPSLAHLFGTDQLGRDMFSRVMFGGRASVPAAVVVVAIGFPLGTALGALAGYAGGAVEEVIMRITDMFLAFPVLVLAMAVAAALGASLLHGAIALAVVWWPSYVRVTRGMVLDIKNRDYVTASRAAGRHPMGVLARVIMPNVLPSVLVMAAVDVGRAILMFSMLSFLGLGAKPPDPEWGSMVASGAQFMDQWWVAAFPGLSILSLVFAFNLAGDSIRDAMDPWVQGRR